MSMTYVDAQPSYRLRLRINNTKPIDLKDFTDMLSVLSGEYNAFTRALGLPSGDSKLQVYGVERGSVVVDLVDVLSRSAVLSFMEDTVTLVAFGQYVVSALDYLSDKRSHRPESLTHAMIDGCNKLVEHLRKDVEGGAQLSIINGDNNTIISNYYTSADAHRIAKRVKEERDLDNKEEQDKVIHEGVLIRFTRLSNDKSKANKGVIEDISPKKLSLLFSEGIKEELLETEGVNPFSNLYVVDVKEVRSQGILKAYWILRLHGVVEDDDDE